MELEKSFHFLTGRFLFILFGTPILWAIFLLYSSAWLSNAKGAFHLSELTCQTSPLVMRNSLLIKIIQPDQSNLKQSPRRRRVFIKNSWKKSISLSKWLVGPQSSRPVLSFGKRPKLALTNFCFITVCNSPALFLLTSNLRPNPSGRLDT